MRDILILQTARLGDLAQTAPVMRALRREHPSALLTLVVQSGLESLVEGQGLCDRLLAVPFGAIEALASPEAQAAFPDIAPFAGEPAFRREYDLLANLSNDLGSAFLCSRISARAKLGRTHTYEGELRLLGIWSKYLYAMVSHRRENLFNLVDIQMGAAGLKPRPEPASLPAPEGRRAEARALLAAAFGSAAIPGRPLVALQAGASLLHRAWSLEHFAVLGAGLAGDPGADLVILGDGRERERCAELAARIGGARVADLSGKTSVPLLQAVLAECDLLVSNDTGSIHVAAAAGVPTLGLFFSTAWFAETAPYGEGHAVLQVDIPCAPCDASNVCPVQICRASLPPEPVLCTARWLLSGAPSARRPVTAPGLSLYRSRFLGDGSLAYLPVRPESASAQFRQALLGRQLWQGALGLEGDPSLDRLAGEFRNEPDFRSRREKLAGPLAEMEARIARGVELSVRLRETFASAGPDRDRILPWHRELSGLGADLASVSQSAGSFGSFLRFDMMDMDYAAYPELAAILEAKYRKLAEQVAGFRKALDRLA
jgi:ADP-heptose:LPS heptosyltransferase